MATIGQRRLEWKTGPLELISDVKVASGETFVEGELGFMAAGLFTELGGDTPAAIYGMAKGGAAAALATGATGRVEVILACDRNVFTGNVLSTSLASRVLLQSDLGRVMAIQRDTPNSRVVLDASTVGGANARVFVHDVVGNQDGEVGDTNARCLFTFLAKFYQAGATS